MVFDPLVRKLEAWGGCQLGHHGAVFPEGTRLFLHHMEARHAVVHEDFGRESVKPRLCRNLSHLIWWLVMVAHSMCM